LISTRKWVFLSMAEGCIVLLMLRFLALTVILLALCGTGLAQDEERVECSTLDVIGPPGIPRPGERVSLTADIRPLKPEWPVRYRWHVSHGTIVSGQDSASIAVKIGEDTTLTATVEVSGLPGPNLCPRVASGTMHWDPPPQPIRIGVVYSLESSNAETKFKDFADELTANPSNQGYIIIGSRPETNPSEIDAREKKILEKYRPLFGYHPPRMTLVRWGGKADLIELWRVPPGADNPTCTECGTQLKCPTISVTGPAGIAMPGTTVYFRAAIDGDSISYTRLRWTVSDGTILSGQNALTLGVRMPKLPPVTATILVAGLPKDCWNSASDRYDFAVDPGPILIDEFGWLANDAIRRRLNKFVAELQENPNNQGYIILYGTNKELAARERPIINEIRLLNVDPSRITVVRGGTLESGKVYTKLYRVPPGADNPVP
jgi:hypothetical protein